MVKTISVGESKTFTAATDGDTDERLRGVSILPPLVGGYDHTVSGKEVQANARTLAASTTIAIAESWIEIDVQGSNEGDAVVEMTGSYDGDLVSVGGKAEVNIDAFIIDKTVEPNEDMVTDSIRYEWVALGDGMNVTDDSFTETMTPTLFPSSNYLIGLRLTTTASSSNPESPLWAESDFYSAGGDSQNHRAEWDEIRITWR